MRYKVLVVGHGYVGKAVCAAFSNDNLLVADPKNNTCIKDYKGHNFDIIFVCVDTPKNENFKTLSTVLKQLNEYFPHTIVVSKSTASPIFYKKAEKKFKKIKLLHSPEYLSHWNNIDDFKNQRFIIMGGDRPSAVKASNILDSRLEYVETIRTTDIETAALVKYAENTFLGLKVTFANELYQVYKKLKINSSFDELTSLIGLDARIGSSHFQVPGRDGKFGWGGHCFEKDIPEFLNFSGSKLVKFFINLNKKHRSSGKK